MRARRATRRFFLPFYFLGFCMKKTNERERAGVTEAIRETVFPGLVLFMRATLRPMHSTCSGTRVPFLNQKRAERNRTRTDRESQKETRPKSRQIRACLSARQIATADPPEPIETRQNALTSEDENKRTIMFCPY